MILTVKTYDRGVEIATAGKHSNVPSEISVIVYALGYPREISHWTDGNESVWIFGPRG